MVQPILKKKSGVLDTIKTISFVTKLNQIF